MIEVFPSLFVGSALDYENVVSKRSNWRVVHACKEPYHRQALGYSGRAAPKSHPEYLLARRENRLMLNLVDADDPRYFPKEVIDAGIAFIDESLADSLNVLVHCNQGQSRAPMIAFLYLVTRTDRLPTETFDKAVEVFRRIYPSYTPSKGAMGFARNNFTEYVSQ